MALNIENLRGADARNANQKRIADLYTQRSALLKEYAEVAGQWNTELRPRILTNRANVFSLKRAVSTSFFFLGTVIMMRSAMNEHTHVTLDI